MDRNPVVDVVIRAAKPEDAEGIAELWSELVAYHHTLHPVLPAAAPDGPARYARAIDDHLRSPTTQVVVAECEGRLAGFALGVVADMVSSFFAHEATGFIADLFVSPRYRRQGIGRQLVLALTNWFGERGLRQFEWHVAAHNEEALAFWRSIGGAPILIRMRAAWPLEET